MKNYLESQIEKHRQHHDDAAESFYLLGSTNKFGRCEVCKEETYLCRAPADGNATCREDLLTCLPCAEKQIEKLQVLLDSILKMEKSRRGIRWTRR